MPNFRWFIIIVLLTSCKGPGHRDDNVMHDSVRQDGLVAVNKKDIRSFLSKFQDITTDTFKIDNSDKFNGVPLDTSEFVWLPIRLKKVSEQDPLFYACFKFSIDATHTGLIMRTPSMYSSSSIKLLVLNIETNTLFDPSTELAESIGDAGFVSKTTSWVTLGKLNQIVIWRHDTEDKSIEDENDTSVVVTDHAFLARLKASKVDTIVMESKDVINLYKKIENKKR